MRRVNQIWNLKNLLHTRGKITGFSRLQKLLLAGFILWGGLLNMGYSQEWLWAVQAGSDRGDDAYGLVTDREGNVYVGGNSGATGGVVTIFGDTVLTGILGGNFVLAKYDSCGNFIWARNPGPSGFAVDAMSIDSEGGIYIVGNGLGGSLDFGNGVIHTAGSTIVLVKYDTDGNAKWTTNFDAGSVEANDIVIDTFNDVYVCGSFRSVISFPDTTLASVGFDDLFFAKYDSSGGFLWAMKGGGSSGDYGRAIATDRKGNIYMAGSTESPSFTIDSINIVQSGNNSTDAFLLKFNRDGRAIWARTSQSLTGYAAPEDITVGDDEGVYVAGKYLSDMILGTDTLLSPGKNLFVAKYDSNGTYQWIKDAWTGNLSADLIIAADTGQGIYLCKSFSDSIDLETFSLYAIGQQDMMIVKYDTAGQAIWAETIGEAAVVPRAFDVSSSGKIVVTGFFVLGVSFGNTQLAASDVLGAPQDLFLATYGSCYVPSVQLMASAQTFCEGDSSMLSILENGCFSYQWLQDGMPIPGNGQPIFTVQDSGSYQVIVSEGGCADTSEAVAVQMILIPDTPQIITVGTDSLASSVEATSYNWFFNGIQLPDSTQIIHATESGIYSLIIGNGICYSDTSNGLEYISTGIASGLVENGFKIFPNPNAGSFTLKVPSALQENIYQFWITDLQGKTVYAKTAFSNTHKLNVAKLNSGLYMIRVVGKKGYWIEKIRIH